MEQPSEHRRLSNAGSLEGKPLPLPPPKSLQLTKSYSSNHNQDSNSPSDADISPDPDYPDSRFECAICIHWLNEPVLTSCGHRFCKSCLNSWLRQHNQCCPLDNKQLNAELDIFPDNFTRREIEQMACKCPNSPQGCNVIASPLEIDRHLNTCPYRRQNSEEKCPFASVKCEFVGRPETNALEEHLKQDMPLHMQLMLKAFQQNVISAWNAPQKPNQNGIGAAAASSKGAAQHASNELADEQLVQAMYQRIVVLEQRAREQDVKLENLQKQLSNSQQHVDPRYSNGTIIWEVTNFTTLVEHLRNNSNNLIYSRECYTSPYGYKFCARLNIQPKREPLLSLHVHLMQSENDTHLEWPFKGRIKLCMIHPRDANLSQHDTIMTKPEILAFHRPLEKISTRGFGFVEYANIANIINRGFCEGDKLVLKIEINIV